MGTFYVSSFRGVPHLLAFAEIKFSDLILDGVSEKRFAHVLASILFDEVPIFPMTKFRHNIALQLSHYHGSKPER